MRKRITLLYLFLAILFVIGCENTMNTPTHKVESFFYKYQNLDKNVVNNLHYIIEKDMDITSKQKNNYMDLLKKQYHNLSYKIKNEQSSDDGSIVECEIEVLDYNIGIKKAKEYYQEWLDENHLKEDKEKYIDLELEEMGKVKNTIKYTISFHLIKKNGVWELEEISDVDRKKIHGMY